MDHNAGEKHGIVGTEAADTAAVTSPDSHPVAHSKSSEENPVKVEESADEEDEDEKKYPHGVKLVSIMASIYMAMFLISIDRTILVTAIPRITDDFNSISDVGWYGSAYLVTNSAVMLLFGKIYTIYSVKWVFLSAIGVFEIGSAICGAAPNSTSFIIGRAVAGLGSSGLLGGAITILIHTVPLRKRPLFQAPVFALLGLSTIVAPLIGGALTDHVSWRWCFYINLPIGGVTIILLSIILQLPKEAKTDTTLTRRQQLLNLDPLGTATFVPGIICLLLALEWGGFTYAWSSWRIILLLVLSAVLLPAFILIQAFKPSTATVPPHIFVQRSIYAAFSYMFFIGASQLVFIYYLPLYFQSIQGVSALDSGIRLIPTMLPLILGSFISGGVTFLTGYYTPPMIAGSIVLSIGAGLLTTLKVHSTSAQWIGFQVIFGLGLGLGTQTANMAAQTVLPVKEAPIGASMMFFGQATGGSIFLAVAQNIFNDKLVGGLKNAPSVDQRLAGQLVKAGATDLRGMLTRDQLAQVLVVYNNALTRVFVVGLALACASIFGALWTEWKNVKKVKEERARQKDEPTESERETEKSKPHQVEV